MFFWKNPEKNHGFRKNIKQHDIFNIDNNNKCFLSTKSTY